MQRSNNFLSVTVVILISFVAVLVYRDVTRQYMKPGAGHICRCVGDFNEATKQRNQLSKTTNKIQEQLQQLICQVQKQSSTSSTGGWCDDHVHTGHVTDGTLADALSRLFAGKTVIGLGDGPGEYRKLLKADGKVRQYDAFDGAPNIANISAGQVNFLDLTLPQYWLPTYDWVLCLEVLEHIPAEFERAAVDNIDRAAGEGAVISWAVPGQGGVQHVNLQPPEYVEMVFKNLGFQRDNNMTTTLRAAANFYWLKNNIMVFRRIRRE